MALLPREITWFLTPFRYEIIYLWPQKKDTYANNTGFSPTDAEIAERFPYQKYQIQLYDELLKVAGFGKRDLLGRAVMEVCSGLGGGLRYIAEAYSPRVLVGVDSSITAVRRSRRRGLDVRRAFAERLPLGDRTFDCILCVDSMNAVFDAQRSIFEMERVLAPSGIILNADFVHGSIERARSRLERWAAAAGLEISAFRDVSANARQAILDDHPRNLAIFEAMPKFLRRFAAQALTVKGSERYRRWENSEYSYYLATLTHRVSG